MQKDDKNSIPTSLKPYLRPPIVGAALAGLLVLSPIIAGGHIFLMFFSIGGLIIVGGGVVTVAFMSFESDEVQKALDAIRRLFKETKKPSENLQSDITPIIYCSRLIMEKGMRDLESIIGKVGVRDPFVKYGLNMVVSEYSPDDVRAMMETAADAGYERESKPVEVLQAMTSHAPAFGMVGTLVGMVAMMCNLNDSMSSIGPSLAVAFLSTLYGVLSARMIYIPAASKLQQEVAQHRFRNQLITEGMAMLAGKKTPMYVQDRLNSFLRPESYNYVNVAIASKPPKQAPRPMASKLTSAA